MKGKWRWALYFVGLDLVFDFLYISFVPILRSNPLGRIYGSIHYPPRLFMDGVVSQHFHLRMLFWHLTWILLDLLYFYMIGFFIGCLVDWRKATLKPNI